MSGSTKLNPLEWAPSQTARLAVCRAFIWGTKPVHILLCACVWLSVPEIICVSLQASSPHQSMPGKWLKMTQSQLSYKPKEMPVNLTVYRKENVIYSALIGTYLPVISFLPYFHLINSVYTCYTCMCCNAKDITAIESRQKKIENDVYIWKKYTKALRESVLPLRYHSP